MPARRGPIWTTKRIKWALTLAYGTNRRGGVDTAAVAAHLGVSQRTVQRWLAGGPRTAVPTAHLERILSALRPTAATLVREQQAADYARDAITQIGLGRGRGILPSWRERRWLEPHMVVVIAIASVDIRQVAFCRDDDRPVTDLRRRGPVLDVAVVPTRFHAVALVHEVLTAVHDWRISADTTHLAAGMTRAFAPFARAIDLVDVARTHQLTPLASTRHPIATPRSASTASGTVSPPSAQ